MENIGINLYKSRSRLSADEAVLLSRLRIVAAVITSIVLIAGVIVGIMYFAAQLRYNSATSEKATLLKRMSLSANKEAYLHLLEYRLPIIARIITNQHPWQDILNLSEQIVPAQSLQSITFGTNNTIQLAITVNSIADVKTIVDQARALSMSGTMKNPSINSLQQQKNGKINAIIEFVPGH